MNIGTPLAATAVAALVCASAQAGVVGSSSGQQFSDRASFDAAAGHLSGFESFENEPQGFIGAGTTYTTHSGLGVTVEKGPIGSVANLGFEFLGSFATDGDNHIRVRAFELRLDLPEPSNAIGFDVTDYPELHGSVMTFVTDAGTQMQIPFSSFGNQNSQFFGFIADGFTFDTVWLYNTRQNLDPYGLDAISFGATANAPIIPLPSAALLSTAGVCLISTRRRRESRE